MLAVVMNRFDLDSPLSSAEEEAANDTCAKASLEGWGRHVR
jgi:hypothetical protein